MFKDRWVKNNDGAWITKDNEKHGNAALVMENDDGSIFVVVRRLLSDRYLDARNYGGNDLETIDEGKDLAEEFISQLMEIGE